MELDFSRTICDRKKLAVWFAFMEETRSRPIYMKTCAEYDRRYVEVEAELFAELLRDDAESRHDPQVLATTLDALIDGLWLDILLTPKEMDRNRARNLVLNYLHTVLPDYFRPSSGLE